MDVVVVVVTSDVCVPLFPLLLGVGGCVDGDGCRRWCVVVLTAGDVASYTTIITQNVDVRDVLSYNIEIRFDDWIVSNDGCCRILFGTC